MLIIEELWIGQMCIFTNSFIWTNTVRKVEHKLLKIKI